MDEQRRRDAEQRERDREKRESDRERERADREREREHRREERRARPQARHQLGFPPPGFHIKLDGGPGEIAPPVSAPVVCVDGGGGERDDQNAGKNLTGGGKA